MNAMRLIQEVIGSASKVQLLAKVIDSSDRFTVSEFAAHGGLPKSTTSLIIDEWEKAGFVKTQMIGPTKMVQIVQNHPLYKPLRMLIQEYNQFIDQTIKTIKKNKILQSSNIKAVLVYGSLARKNISGQSDADMLIIAEKEDLKADEKLREKFDQEIKLPISIAWMTPDEITKRIKQKDSFIKNVLREGIPIKGGEWVARTKRTL